MPELVFYLTTHHAGWLWDPRADFPLFVSHRRLRDYRNLYPATHGWALDSGGFTELSMYGKWMTTPREYVEAVARYDREIGRLEWAAPQDWLCSPLIIHGGKGPGGITVPGTGLTKAEHQRRTVANFLELRELWPEFSDAECPIMPALQGHDDPDDYGRCEALYRAAGVRLEDYPVVGLGSLVGQDTDAVNAVVRAFTPRLALHGFGVKTQGLARYGRCLTSADSLAWSYNARRLPPLPGHTHKNCANCLDYARVWRRNLLDGYDAAPYQLTLDEVIAAS